ncbi:MAG TPA: COR domain-containing protein [Thermoanaerobaculia bacterium]|nr:COR domain-containing protein [Thermoanaerobaculia bacterium]
MNCVISYARSDGAKYVAALARALDAAHVQDATDAWLSAEDMAVGDSWAEAIRRRMARADAVIYVGTPQALKSDSVEAEISVAKARDITVIPLIFEGVSASRLPDYIREYQFIIEDARALDVGPSPRVLDKLLRALPAVQATRATPQHQAERLQGVLSPLNEGKLILVGRGEVGKTSLVRRLVENDFRGDESKTQGINIATWPVLSGANSFRLNIWDFGGQEIMHATHQFFLTERSLYLLVLNGREGGEDLDAEYWLKHIQSFGGDSPVIIVQNKISQHPFDLNYRGLQARYPQIRRFVKTDCRDDVGVAELRETIRTVIEQMPEVQMKLPAHWFAVKRRLESMSHEFMSYERFRRLCDDEGVTDEPDRDTLSVLLHCLGIALHYRDDSRLRETAILKPEWVTQGIYKILNAPTLAQRQGELFLDDLREILPQDRYPPDKHLFLLELMRKFSLCFAFSDDRDHYLIPDLLGKEEPPETRDFVPAQCLNFEYHYGILPEGLIPRFIVRSHTLSRGQERWRSGAILARKDCTALVTAIPADRRVIVRVKGGDAVSRRELLALIRYDFDRINGEFKDRLDAKPMVPLAQYPAFAIDYEKLFAFQKQNVRSFPEYVGDDVVSIDVNELLNGVDLQEQRQSSLATLASAKSLFLSYSHKDERLRDELETHLKLLQRLDVISVWHDRKILAGTEWDGEIDARLERAKVILLLVSADFLASDYCWSREVKRGMERHEAGEATVIPIMLRSCDWKGAPFEKLQGLPPEMKAVTSFEDRDVAWTAVASGIRAVAETL